MEVADAIYYGQLYSNGTLVITHTSGSRTSETGAKFLPTFLTTFFRRFPKKFQHFPKNFIYLPKFLTTIFLVIDNFSIFVF